MSGPDAPIVRARGLRKDYGAGRGLVRAVDEVDLDVARGEALAVMGPSGCGKSTLLHLLGGLDRPTAGEVWLSGRRIDRLSQRALALMRQKEVGFVFQAFHLMEELTAQENVELPALLAGRTAGDRAAASPTPARPGEPRRSGRPSPVGALGRRTPARGHRPGARQRADARARRRADRQPRQRGRHRRSSRCSRCSTARVSRSSSSPMTRRSRRARTGSWRCATGRFVIETRSSGSSTDEPGRLSTVRA